MYENYLKCRISILAPFKIDLSGKTVWPQALGFQNLAKIDLLWYLKINIECDFLGDFQILWKFIPKCLKHLVEGILSKFSIWTKETFH